VTRARHGIPAAPGRLASGLLIASGAALLIVSAGSVARAALARDAARTRWAELEAQRAVRGARAVASDGVRWTAARGAPVARLVIPRLGLDEVVVEGVADGELRAGPGHMTGSACRVRQATP
jgi:sortase A